ncbi:ribonuclease H-like domain-containing protein [bacterium]|nr:ribonuclease H-like domain-containing protein [bacterium]
MAGQVKIGYLDIETSYQGSITIVGVYVPGEGTRQLVGSEVTSANVLEIVAEVGVIKTYNGDRFDLPVIKRRLGLDLKSLYRHEDIMFRCWKHRLKGGLKSVERQLGFVRETEGVDGMQAMSLWAAWIEKQDQPALDLLLHYNREDVEFLEKVDQKLSQLDAVAKSVNL